MLKWNVDVFVHVETTIRRGDMKRKNWAKKNYKFFRVVGYFSIYIMIQVYMYGIFPRLEWLKLFQNPLESRHKMRRMVNPKVR